MRIREQKIQEFLDSLSSKSPTPGGGAVAALAAALAAALVEMVVNLTKGEELKEIGIKARGLREKLLELSDKDSQAFDGVITAYRSKDKTAIKKALQAAIEVPAETKEQACLIQKLAKVAIENGNKNAVSDARTALYLAEAAEKSAEENVRINEASLAKLA